MLILTITLPFTLMNESLGTPYGEDDKEADNIYDSVDEFMEGRKKRKREEQLLEEARNKARTERPKIADQFADLKQDLAMVGDSHRPPHSSSVLHQCSHHSLHTCTLKLFPSHPPIHYQHTLS